MEVTWICTSPEADWQQRSPDSTPFADACNLRLDGTRHQTWEGFGGCFNELGWIALSALEEKARARILDNLFADGGCAFNLCRLPIGASDYAAEWYSYDEHEGDYGMEHFSIARDERYLLPYLRAALAVRPGLTLFASPWSPPTWMKFPRAYNHGSLVWTPENLRTYALYFAKFVLTYREAGIRIGQVHVQNEPNSDQKFPSCLWTGEKMRDFIRDYLGPLFRERGLDCEIWAGTIERGDYNAWANTILSDPAAKAFISGVGYQWAGRDAVQRTHLSWPDVRLFQTENECGDGLNTWDHAGHVFDLLHHYITNGVVGYCYWNMVLEPGGRSTWGWRQNAMITIDPATRNVIYNPEFYVMKHLAAFVKPGAVRLGLSGGQAANAVAFDNPDGETVVAVRNPFRDSRPVALDLGAGNLFASLPPLSLNTFVRRPSR